MSLLMVEIFYGPIEPTWIMDPGQVNSENPYRTHAGEETLAPIRSGNRRTGRGEDRSMTTVHYMVPLCCDKCEKDLKKMLLDSDDVERVTCDQWTKKVIITSSIHPKKLLKRLQKFKTQSTFWSHRPS